VKVIFAGTPEFARQALAAILAAGHEVVLVLTQPDRPSGRGMKLSPSPVKAEAEKHGIPVYQPERLKDPATHDPIREANADVMVVAAYGLILPQTVLDIPKLGCLNIHASLLPRWRGAAPIQRALMAGDAETGITIMLMDEGLDTGPMLLQERVPIGPEDDAGMLHEKLASMGARLILSALDGLASGALTAQPQPSSGVTYAAKLTRDDERLDWRRSAEELARQVRGLSPRPGAWFAINGDRLKVLAGEVIAETFEVVPGVVLDDRLTIACGHEAFRIARIQRAGRAPMSAKEFLRGYRVPQGVVLPTPDDASP
jgi:methionyl-tRNA formyltransferase